MIVAMYPILPCHAIDSMFPPYKSVTKPCHYVIRSPIALSGERASLTLWCHKRKNRNADSCATLCEHYQSASVFLGD